MAEAELRALLEGYCRHSLNLIWVNVEGLGEPVHSHSAQLWYPTKIIPTRDEFTENMNIKNSFFPSN